MKIVGNFLLEKLEKKKFVNGGQYTTVMPPLCGD